MAAPSFGYGQKIGVGDNAQDDVVLQHRRLNHAGAIYTDPEQLDVPNLGHLQLVVAHAVKASSFIWRGNDSRERLGRSRTQGHRV
jgi:hypothetical protein